MIRPLSLLTLTLHSSVFAASATKISTTAPEPEAMSKLLMSTILCSITVLIYITLQYALKKLKLPLSKNLLINGIGGVSCLLAVIIMFTLFANKTIRDIGKEIHSLTQIHLPLTKMITTIAEHQLSQEIHLERFLRTKLESERSYYNKLSNQIKSEFTIAQSLVKKWVEYPNNTVDEKELSKKSLQELNKIFEIRRVLETKCSLIFEGDITEKNPNECHC